MKKESGKRKAYFVAPLFAKEKYSQAYKSIADILRKNNYSVWDDVNKISADDARAMSEQEIRSYFNEVEKRIKRADVFVAELSETSASIGYEVGLAVAYLKPILILRLDKLRNDLGAPFRAANKTKMYVLRYNQKTLEAQIERFLRKAQKGIFVKKLLLRFTQEQVDYFNYLQKQARRRPLTTIIREIVDRVIRGDKEYQDKQNS
ncbi:nucleoside 2-deoxyribosyltransferase [Candidatus Dojkabacteria bacterium]|nr:nucleoside 2-deoxyribosyltransferase [Candidatus Dojkabacteria bacterium]